MVAPFLLVVVFVFAGVVWCDVLNMNELSFGRHACSAMRSRADEWMDRSMYADHKS